MQIEFISAAEDNLVARKENEFTPISKRGILLLLFVFIGFGSSVSDCFSAPQTEAKQSNPQMPSDGLSAEKKIKYSQDADRNFFQIRTSFCFPVDDCFGCRPSFP